MAVRRVIEYPSPVLRHSAVIIEQITPRHEELIRDLMDTMQAFPGCVGLAANQIGEPDRIAVVDVSSKESEKQKLVLINPVIIEFIGGKFLREGCLSVQNLTANVKRAEEVVAEWQDIRGNKIRYHAKGVEAICIQHEVDHLNGALFIDHVVSPQTDIFRRKRYLH